MQNKFFKFSVLHKAYHEPKGVLNSYHKEIILTGAFYFTGQDFYALCELYRRGFEPDKAVSHIWNLDEAPLACKMFFEGKTGKVLLERKV